MAADGTVTMPVTPASTGFNNTVRFYKATGSGTAAGDVPFQLDWQIKIGGGSFISIGSTKHTVYVTAGDPIGPALNKRLETVFSVACRRANNIAIDIEDRIPEAIWAEFIDRHVERVIPSTGDTDGVAMGYYANIPDTMPAGAATAGTPTDCGGSTEEMLKLRNGVCGAWADFFRDLLAVHGISCTSRGLEPKGTLIQESALVAALNQKYGTQWSNLDPSFQRVLFVKNWTATDPLAPVPAERGPCTRQPQSDLIFPISRDHRIQWPAL